MSVTSGDERSGLADLLGDELRQVILEELENQGLSDPRSLADRLGAPVAATAEFFRRRHWPVETYLDVIDELNLPIRVTSQNIGRSLAS